jgi:photosystem II stability/assembly factor-like uncharacterized protein
MKRYRIFSAARVILLFVTLILAATVAVAQADDPNIDHAVYSPTYSPQPRTNSQIMAITTPDGYDNFDLGVDFAEGHTSTNPRNPLWWFNCWNTANTSNHHTENGLDWSSGNAPFPTNSGDPASAYDSLGNVYWMTMNGPTITGTWVVKSTNNGQTWGSAVASNIGNDKNWLAADQTMGPFANYVYGTMTNSGTGSFTRSTDLGATFTQTWSFSSQTLPGMMVCVGPNVLSGNNVPGGCVYVVTNSGSSFAATYTFYRSTDGGATFTFSSAQNFANYVGTNVGGRNSVQNFRTRPYPFITADNSYGPLRGRLYLIYASNNPAGDGNKSDVYCRYSTDQGVTWSSPTIINDDANSQNNYQWHPATWSDKETGRLYVKWLDTRDTPSSDSCDVYASYSDNGGTTFVPNQRLTNRKFRINCTTCGGGGTPAYLGDYDAITSNRYGAMAVWTDFRNGTFLSMAGYFPDFAMTVSPPADTLGLTDSVNIVLRIPSVRLYSRYVKFSASVSPPANFTFSFIGNRDSLTRYPDSAVMKIRANGVAQGVYTVTVVGKGPDGAATHRRTITISALPALVQVLQPNGGEQMFVGSAYPISWAKNLVDTVKIEYSTDNGSSWNLISPGVPASSMAIIHPKLRAKGVAGPTETSALAVYNWIVPNTPSANCLVRVSDKNNAGVFDVSDASFTIVARPAPRWTTLTSGSTVNLYGVSLVDTSVAWAAGDSGRTYRTVNGGASWLSRASVTNSVSSISAVNTSLAVAASNAAGNARIMRTNNGGLSWTTAYQDTSTGAYIDAIKMFDTNNGFAVGDPVGGQWRLLRTTNGGAAWSSAGTLPQSGSEFGWGNSMSWVGQNGWFGTDNSRVYRTTDGGTNWTSSATAFTNSYAVSFATDQLGIASGNGAARSSNGGGTWTNTPTQPPVATFGSVAVPLTPNRWYSVAGGSVYKSTDHGGTWPSDFSQANAYEAIDMKVVSVGGNNWLVGYAVGDNGTITKYIEILPPTSISQKGDDIPKEFALEQNYPNPFNPSTIITYSLPEQSAVKLKVFDILGQEVRTLINGTQNAGSFEATWDGQNNAGTQVASGVYYYRLEASSLSGANHVRDKKMLLVK